MKQYSVTILLLLFLFFSPPSYSSVLSDKMSGTQTESTNKTVNTGETETRKTNQLPEKPKQTIVNNPKVDEFMGLSSSKIKLYFGILVIFGFFIFGFGKYLMTGKQ